MGGYLAQLLLLHGERDARVNAQESRQMAEALKRANKTFECKTCPSERHGFAHPASALGALSRIEQFLDSGLALAVIARPAGTRHQKRTTLESYNRHMGSVNRQMPLSEKLCADDAHVQNGKQRSPQGHATTELISRRMWGTTAIYFGSYYSSTFPKAPS